MTEVLEKSLNTGSIFVVQKLGNEKFYQYIHDFGFGEKTGIELAGERAGSLTNLEQLKDIYSYTTSYGQGGATVTPLQVLTAYAALANEGKLMKPYIIQKRITTNDEEIVTQPQVVRQVVSANTARTISFMLVSVIDKEHRSAKVPGYFMGGKTGTAQIAEHGKYHVSKHNDTFVGYPVTNPQFIMLTKIDEPTEAPWAEQTVVPLWGDIAQFLVNYYQIPPDRNE
jgi:cell division protein FtsI/penicillin-binding protein 2